VNDFLLAYLYNKLAGMPVGQLSGDRRFHLSLSICAGLISLSLAILAAIFFTPETPRAATDVVLPTGASLRFALRDLSFKSEDYRNVVEIFFSRSLGPVGWWGAVFTSPLIV